MEIYQGENFWSVRTAYKPGMPLNQEKRHIIEGKLGVTLPDEYIELMNKQNGGELQYRYIVFEDGEAIIIPFFFEMDVDSGVGMSPIIVDQYGLPDELVLLTGDLEAWVALDYRNRKIPKVVYFIQEETGMWQEFEIAASFSEFLKKLIRK
ncbi:SMI1/KNR4 family protein [Bacillus sp. JCM 19034]|uniref:SMI1/KNR4 family protein n=1 Tax=Bacillus sp. JCM 19034 TaxID=1481928 RepID=UPI000B155639|nr:SMI1/KNR4 family protein [Bacillus sp. JCM 19034]